METLEEWHRHHQPDAERYALKWLDHPESRAAKKALRAFWSDSARCLPLSSRGKRRVLRELRRHRPVALGDLLPRHDRGTGRLFTDTFTVLAPRRGEAPLQLSLCDGCPPFLWQELAPSGEALRQLLAPYETRHYPVAFPARTRAYIGRDVELGAGIHELCRSFLHDPFTEQLHWGSAWEEDPYPPHFWCLGDDRQAELLDNAHLQAPNRAPSYSFRSILSQSIITLEDHEGLFVADLRYEPTGPLSIIRRLNDRIGTSFPSDLPLDVLMSLFGLHFQDSQSIRRALREEPADAGYWLSALEVVENAQDLRPELGLHAQTANPELREMVAYLAFRRGYGSLLHHMVSAEKDDGLRQRMCSALRKLAD